MVMGFVGVAVFVVVVMGMGVDVGMSVRRRVGTAVRVRRRANWDRHDGLVGYTAAFPFCEYSQPSQNTSE